MDIEVDRQLFVTCRLCLGDLGVYQIVPLVQQQIKYCFDIDVELFDGLPQLICKKCKNILQEHFQVKQTFLEKQATLKKKLADKNEEATNEGHHDDLPENSPCSNAPDGDEIIKPTRGKRKRYRLPSSSSSDNVDVKNYEIVKKRHKYSKTSSWKNFYKRKFVCQLCSKICKKKSSVTKHLKKHNTLLSKYPAVFNRDCKVELNKIDDTLNMTGTNDNVVISVDRIVSNNEGSNNYYAMYTPKKDSSGSRLNSFDGNNQDGNGESSDDDFIGQKECRTRSHTRSSNETVILNDDNAEVPKNSSKEMLDENEYTNSIDAECINIDDSSDNESTTSSKLLRGSADMNVKAKISDYKSIQNILSMCLNRYLKKMECAENDPSKGLACDESKLKRIILNMGQKVVSKQGVNCTGLLRFMENSDLNIKWIQANSKSPKKNICKESNYVYIQPKLVSKLNNADAGWIDISTHHTLPVNYLFGTENSDSTKGYSKSGSNSSMPISSMSTTDKAHGKLLNKSPVANPKQLPKKTYPNPSSENTDPEPVFATEEVNGDGLSMPMPIITSTTSLAVQSIEVRETASAIEDSAVSDNENVNKTIEEPIQNSAVLKNRNVEDSIENPVVSNNKKVKETEKNTPRIKVKPVSELMSARVLKNLSQTQQVNTANIWETSQSSNIQPVAVNHIPILMPNGTNALPDQALQIIPYQCVGGAAGSVPGPVAPAPPAPPVPSAKEHVVLDTVYLPNTRTDSPFKYVKKLLQIHNLVLLDSHESLTRDFVGLIKFKLQFKQENIDEPVVLFLSFQCFGNKFYLGVKHSEQENNIDLSKLPANWQWEIINKVYREEVVNKVLKNAQKISQSTHDYAKSFLCLLKSIKKLDVIS